MEEGRNKVSAVIATAKHENDERGCCFKYIPEEIVLSILPNLPLESLLRFRCVSKQWSFSIITKLRKVIVPSNKPFLFESIDKNAQVEDIEIEVEKSITTPYPNAFPCFYGSCNGLLLIRVGINLILWNPSTRRSYGMLTYRLLTQYPLGKVIPGLCFDSNNNDYKVVLGLNNPSWRDRYVCVGSFKSKSWYRIDFLHNVSHFKSGPTLDNYLYWWSSDEIIYFDAKINKFMKLSLPEEFVEDKHDICGLGVMDGSLCMVRYQMPHTGCAVYGRKLCGVKDSWELMFTFQLIFTLYENDYGCCHNRREVRFTHPTPLFFANDRRRRVLIHVRRTEYEWRCGSNVPEKLSDEYVVVAYDVDDYHCTDIAVSKIAKCAYDGVAVYEEALVRPVSMPNEPKSSNTRNRSDVVPFGGKNVWKVKGNVTKAAEIVIVEEMKVATGVEEKWEESRKTRGRNQQQLRRPRKETSISYWQ